jgi:hypothetical protein
VFEVPVTRVGDPRRSARRSRVAVLAAVGSLTAVVVFALVSQAPPRALEERLDGIARPSGPAVLDRSDPSGGTQAGVPASAADPARREAPLDVVDATLPANVAVDLVFREQVDLVVERWSPGRGVSLVQRFEGLTRADPASFPIVAPDRRAVLELELPMRISDAGSARLSDRTGAPLWEGPGLLNAGAVWAPDSRLVVVAGPGAVWHLVTLSPRGATATDRVVQLAAPAFPPSPAPIGQLSSPEIGSVPVPLGLSADERWIHGVWASGQVGTTGASFRVSTDGAVVEPTATLGVGRPDGLRAGSGSAAGVDPVTGRIASLTSSSDPNGSSPTIEVRNPDNSYAFLAGDEFPLGMAWHDETLYLLQADSAFRPQRVRLVPYNAGGVALDPVLTLGNVESASLIGVEGPLALVALTVGEIGVVTQLVFVDLDDRSVLSGLRLEEDPAREIVAANLVALP